MLRGITRVATGALGSQAVLFFTSLVIARILLPNEFGQFAVVSSVALVVSTVCSLRLDLAVSIPSQESQAQEVLSAALVVGLIVASILLVVVVAIANPLASALGLKDPWLLILLPIVSLLGTWFSSLNQWAIRKRRYGRLAVRNVTQAAVTGLSQIIFSLIGAGALGLILGLAFGQLIGVLLLGGLREAGHTLSTPPRVCSIMRENRRFIGLMAPSALVNQISTSAPLVLGASLFSAEFAGWFGLTQRTLAVPLAIVGVAIGQVVLGDLGGLIRSGDVLALMRLRKALLVLMLMGVLFGATIALVGPELYATVFGSTFAESGYYARGLAVGLAAQVAVSPISVLLLVAGGQVQQFVWDLLRLSAILFVLLAAGHNSLSPRLTVAMLGITNAILYGALIVLVILAVRRRVGRSSISVKA